MNLSNNNSRKTSRITRHTSTASTNLNIKSPEDYTTSSFIIHQLQSTQSISGAQQQLPSKRPVRSTVLPSCKQQSSTEQLSSSCLPTKKRRCWSGFIPPVFVDMSCFKHRMLCDDNTRTVMVFPVRVLTNKLIQAFSTQLLSTSLCRNMFNVEDIRDE